MSTTNDRIRKRLILKHDPDKIAVWCIRGEDPNADVSGHHATPTLAYVKGKFNHVVEYAFGLKKFITWGFGGDITPIDIINIDGQTMAMVTEARERVRRLEDELRNAKETLKRMEVE